MKLLIGGGGTGGHVFPAIAVAREWSSRGPDREVVIVGTAHGIETRLVPQAGLRLETIRAAGLKGIGGFRLLHNAAMLLPGLYDAEAIVRRYRFHAAFGVGGYAAGPILFMAAMHGVPAVIFEPNVVPGLANRWLAPLARRIATAHEATAQHWARKAVVTGCPVRPEFFQAPERPHQPPFTVLITGGSRGALPVNRAVVDALDLLVPHQDRLFLVHQTGERDYNAVRVAYARRQFQAEVVPFLQNMAEQFARADLILCRAGAITVAEVAAAGRAAIFIPFGAATDSHQLANARAMERAGAARVIPQPELTPARLVSEILSLLDHPEQLTAMERRARQQARPRAVADIVTLIEEVARR